MSADFHFLRLCHCFSFLFWLINIIRQVMIEKLLWTNVLLLWIRNCDEFTNVRCLTKHFSAAKSVSVKRSIRDFTLLYTRNCTFYCSCSSDKMEFLTNSPLEIHNDGTVIWFYISVYTSSCAVYVKWFPFDTQVCKLIFSSWVYTGQELELFPDYSRDGTQNR